MWDKEGAMAMVVGCPGPGRSLPARTGTPPGLFNHEAVVDEAFFVVD